MLSFQELQAKAHQIQKTHQSELIIRLELMKKWNGFNFLMTLQNKTTKCWRAWRFLRQSSWDRKPFKNMQIAGQQDEAEL